MKVKMKKKKIDSKETKLAWLACEIARRFIYSWFKDIKYCPDMATTIACSRISFMGVLQQAILHILVEASETDLTQDSEAVKRLIGGMSEKTEEEAGVVGWEKDMMMFLGAGPNFYYDKKNRYLSQKKKGKQYEGES